MKQYTIGMMGYAEEHESIVLELTYNYGVTEYTKGNAYAQVSDLDSCYCLRSFTLIVNSFGLNVMNRLQ